MKGIENIGSSLLWVQAAKDSYPTGQDITYMKPRGPVDALRAIVQDAWISPSLRANYPMGYLGDQEMSAVYGVWPAYQRMWGRGLQAGRPISQDDVDQRRRVVVLGMNTARAFFTLGGGGPGKERDLCRQGFHGDRRHGEEGAFARWMTGRTTTPPTCPTRCSPT